jgi:hypothetical protein
MQISIKKAIADAVPVELHMRAQPLTGYDPSPEVVLLASSRDWLLARSLGDGLEPDGYFAVSRRHIRSLLTSKHRTFRKRVLQAEGVWSRALRAPSIDLSSAATILRSVQKLQGFAIVVRETLEDWHSIHCRIERVTEDRAILLGFDGAGQWERRPSHVDILGHHSNPVWIALLENLSEVCSQNPQRLMRWSAYPVCYIVYRLLAYSLARYAFPAHPIQHQIPTPEAPDTATRTASPSLSFFSFGNMSLSVTRSFQLVRFGAVVLSVLLSLFVGFMAQASSPDYRRLFLTILPFAAVDAALVVFVWTTKERGKRWLVAVPALLGFASYLEMACRVLLGFRLL